MVREALTPQGYEVDIVSDGATALQRIAENQYDVALCDWKMPGLNGQQVYERARAVNPALSDRIILSQAISSTNARANSWSNKTKSACRNHFPSPNSAWPLRRFCRRSELCIRGGARPLGLVIPPIFSEFNCRYFASGLGGPRSVPKELLRIARRFNAGSSAQKDQVPKGRPN